MAFTIFTLVQCAPFSYFLLFLFSLLSYITVDRMSPGSPGSIICRDWLSRYTYVQKKGYRNGIRNWNRNCIHSSTTSLIRPPAAYSPIKSIIIHTRSPFTCGRYAIMAPLHHMGWVNGKPSGVAGYHLLASPCFALLWLLWIGYQPSAQYQIWFLSLPPDYFGGLRTTPSYCFEAMLSSVCLKCRLLLSIFDESGWAMFEWISSMSPLMYLVVT